MYTKLQNCFKHPSNDMNHIKYLVPYEKFLVNAIQPFVLRATVPFKHSLNPYESQSH